MNTNEIAQRIIQHMESDHGIKVIPADHMIRIKFAIKHSSPVKTCVPVQETKPLAVMMR
jgi:hypothetical protein